MGRTAATQRFFTRVQTLIPMSHEKYDASHASIMYFCALGLSLLRSEAVPVEDYDAYTRALWCGNGYKGSPSYVTRAGEASVAATYFCLAIRTMMRLDMPSDYDKDAIAHFILSCQNADGSFCAVQGRGEASMRHTYSAVAALTLISRLDTAEPWVRVTADRILECQNYDGGFGEYPGDESHAGLTYCAVATLALCGQLHNVGATLRSFLIRRQNLATGGFNGRPHKPDDVCYSFWVLASLAILRVDTGIDSRKAALQFLKGPGYDPLLGGFVKSIGAHADVYHSALALAALSLLDEENITALDPALVIPKPFTRH